MEKRIFLTLFTSLLFPLSVFASDDGYYNVGNGLAFKPDAPTRSQTCTWTDKEGSGQTATVTTQLKRTLPSQDGGIPIYETCAEATARKQRQMDAGRANQHAQKTITGGSKHGCPWISPDLPNAPSQTYMLELRKIGENANGEPQYESCRSAQKRRQKQWLQTEFNGHREDAEDAIAREQERQQQVANEANESANKKAEKAAKKQKNASMIAAAGSMAAAIAFAASCSGAGSCNYWYAALAAGLGVASMAMGRSSNKNRHVASQYRGGLLADGTESIGGGGSFDGGTDMGDGGDEEQAGVNTGTDGGGNIGGGGDLNLGDPSLPRWDDTPQVKLPDGTVVTPNPSELGPFLEKRGLKWNPGKKSITLPDGKTVSADDLNNDPELRKYAATGAAQAFQNKLKGLGKQIADATGSTDGDGLGADGSSDISDTASLGGGGFSGYDKGGSSGSSGGYGLGSGGGAGSLTAGLDKDKNGNKLAGMSVKMGKNRVGVSQDNIFEMIHRRYQAKRKKRHFIEIGM